MSSGDPRARHRGISHHTLTVLDLLLEPVTVALPAGMRSPVGADLRAGLGAVFGGAMPSRPGDSSSTSSVPRVSPATTGVARASTCRPMPPSGLPAETMGRGLTEDPLFFGAALAAGAALAELAGKRPMHRRRTARRRRRPDASGARSRADGARSCRDALSSDHAPSELRLTGAIEPLMLDFLAYLELERGLSRNTLEAYRSDLLQFGEFLDRRVSTRCGPATAISRRSCPSWQARRSRTARGRRVAAGHAAAQGGVPALVLPPSAPRRNDRARPHRGAARAAQDPAPAARCSRAERSRSCSASPRGTEPLALRDRALLELMYACGLRASEAIGLELGTSTWRRGCCARAARARRSGIVPIGRQAVAALRAYLQRGRPALVGLQVQARLFVNAAAAA